MKPRSLPIWAHQKEILAAVADNPVVIITSPTGTGKTTQLPQMLMDAGIVSSSQIVGVTQPRRLATTSVAAHVAEQMASPLGETVGYKIRFEDITSADTRLKFMTDGVLLMEAQTDPLLSDYGVIVVDEAHERSLNIDFTLGLLKMLLQGQRSRDLKVVIMSATIQPEFFQRYFGGAPVIEATAPMHPVEVRYQPLEEMGVERLFEGVVQTVKNIHNSGEPGDILAFLPGAGPILDSVRALKDEKIPGLVVLPLFGRLSSEEQRRVFDKFPGRRKVICATNIAETSITIDGVRFVIDSGVVKKSRFIPSIGVSMLREELCPLSSCEQRRGRAGRTSPGTCIRLSHSDEMEERAEHGKPDIVSADLSEVVLRLRGLGIRDVKTFPFPTRPSNADLRAAFRLLLLLGALDEDENLTEIGHFILKFPLSPRIGRLIFEAARNAPDVVREVVIAASFLSTGDPYRMGNSREESDERKAQLLRTFGHPFGDVIRNIRVFQGYERSGRSDDFVEQWFLDPKVMKELGNVFEQLSDITEQQGIEVRGGGDWLDVLRCLGRAYPPFILRRVRGRQYANKIINRVFIHPGSSLFGVNPDYIVAGEIVDTRRMYARTVSSLPKKARRQLELDEILAAGSPDDEDRLPKSEGRRRRKSEWMKRKGKSGGGRRRGKKR